MKNLIEDFLDKKNVFAVVGAARDRNKYGFKVYEDLKNAGYKVYPVNPKTDYVLNDKCYPSIADLPELPDVVNVVTQPLVAKEVANTCKELGIRKLWLQPGSESDEVIKFCQDNGIECVHDVCIMIERSKI